MKNLVTEQNIENLLKYMIKATYLKKLSYVSIIIDLISFIAMETLKLVYYDEGEFANTLFFFIAKVNIIV